MHTESYLLHLLQDEELIVLFNASCSKLGITDPVDAVRVVRDSASQLGKGFGFVQFSSPQAARAALGCDGQLLRKRPIRVTKALKVSANLKQLGQKQLKQPDKGSLPGRTAPDRGGSLCLGECAYACACRADSIMVVEPVLPGARTVYIVVVSF